MKKLFLVSIVALVSCIPAFSQTKLIGPPLGLEFGMSYSEAKTALKSKGIKLEKMKKEKKFKFPNGFKVSKVGKYRISDRRTDYNMAVFNADGELCEFRLIFRWSKTPMTTFGEARAMGLKFYNSTLEKALRGKYSGEGFKEHKDPDYDGNVAKIAFEDEVGNNIWAYTLNQKGNHFWIVVKYSNEEIVTATRKQQKATDDI